jgi:hypothetical protein
MTVQGSNPSRVKRFFSSPKTSEPAVGSTQPPVQLVPRFFTKLKLSELEVDHALLSSAEVENEWSHKPTVNP